MDHPAPGESVPLAGVLWGRAPGYRGHWGQGSPSQVPVGLGSTLPGRGPRCTHHPHSLPPGPAAGLGTAPGRRSRGAPPAARAAPRGSGGGSPAGGPPRSQPARRPCPPAPARAARAAPPPLPLPSPERWGPRKNGRAPGRAERARGPLPEPRVGGAAPGRICMGTGAGPPGLRPNRTGTRVSGDRFSRGGRPRLAWNPCLQVPAGRERGIRGPDRRAEQAAAAHGREHGPVTESVRLLKAPGWSERAPKKRIHEPAGLTRERLQKAPSPTWKRLPSGAGGRTGLSGELTTLWQL